MVELTSEGRAALTRSERAQRAIEDDVLQALDPEERRILRQLLARALRSVEPIEDAAPLIGAGTPAS